MRKCRNCNENFEPEAFEVFCSVDCTAEGNSKPKELSTRPAEGGGFVIGIVPDTPGWSEAEFQSEVIEKLLKPNKWRWYHTHNSRRSVAGYPDLTCVRERVVFIELKTEEGVESADQLNWIDDLKRAGAEVYVFRPSQWWEIAEILK